MYVHDGTVARGGAGRWMLPLGNPGQAEAVGGADGIGNIPGPSTFSLDPPDEWAVGVSGR